jgi:hypothetical protein
MTVSYDASAVKINNASAVNIYNTTQKYVALCLWKEKNVFFYLEKNALAFNNVFVDVTVN